MCRVVAIWLIFAVSAFAGNTEELNSILEDLDSHILPQGTNCLAGFSRDDFRAANQIVLLEFSKHSLGLGYQSGKGVLLLKDSKRASWGSPVFLSLSDISIGFQAGVNQNYALLLSTNIETNLISSATSFGADLHANLGSLNARLGKKNCVSQPTSGMISTTGAYLGIAIGQGTLKVDRGATWEYYDDVFFWQDVCRRDHCLSKQPPEATKFVEKLNRLLE